MNAPETICIDETSEDEDGLFLAARPGNSTNIDIAYRRADLPPKVKPLGDFIEITDDDCDFEAFCFFGRYWVEDHEKSGEWRLYLDAHQDAFIGSFDSANEAKAAAQADYERRILAALDMGEGE